MIGEWNDHTTEVFVPSWELCLEECMLIWHLIVKCPGWVFCPHKLHPFGNKYHSMCCGVSGVMLNIELVEGKDRPAELNNPKYNNCEGKTRGLLLWMLCNYFLTGRYVVLDLGFCVMQAIVELTKEGLFAGGLIKKRR